ncbi:T9SS type A sorting domain-containing protein [uncultured Hymenobacter sp.]|uniref:T9SS type A sorting domain-containing protein n=1 Tax=uncultured Hymenobacter sp. TaxID=170016 RepID=UPI0035CB0E19
MNKRLLSFLLWLAGGLSCQSALAQATAPSQGGEVSLVRVTATTMELRFGNFGSGQGRLVTMAAAPRGMSGSLVPTNDIFYTANPTFGQGSPLGKGFVVYNGSGHSIIVTGLQPATRYYVTNAEYNSVAASIAYNANASSIAASTAPPPVARTTPAPLPVELTAFAGTVDANSAVQLHWTTATERNSASFAIERSLNGETFSKAGRVAAAGSSSSPLTYQWPDPQPLTQPTYYRLGQADRDGAVHYSVIVVLRPAPRLARHLEVFPNPSAGQPIQLSLQGYERETLTLRVADPLGRLVLAQVLTPAAAQYRTALPLPTGLAAGTYVLTLAGNGRPVQKRLIIAD